MKRFRIIGLLEIEIIGEGFVVEEVWEDRDKKKGYLR